MRSKTMKESQKEKELRERKGWLTVCRKKCFKGVISTAWAKECRIKVRSDIAEGMSFG